MSKNKICNLGGPAFGFKNPRRKPEVQKDAHLQKVFKIAIFSRRGKKICRKCYCRLPLDAIVCSKCKNPDLRYKKWNNYRDIFNFNAWQKTRNRMINKI